MPRHRQVTDDEIRDIAALREMGCTYAELEAVYGVSSVVIRRSLDYYHAHLADSAQAANPAPQEQD